MNHLTFIAFLVSLMIAPHSLALLGNLAGAHQHYFIFWVALAVILYWMNVRSMSVLSNRLTTSRSPFPTLLLRSLLLTSRWMTTIMLSAVLLVTAGFAFNETFLYWFPNFAFAFILLGALMFVHFLGRQATRSVQVILSSATLGGLTLLTIMGIWRVVMVPYEVESAQNTAVTTIPFAVLLLFVGFDLALNQEFRKAPALRKTMNMGIYGLALLLVLWGLASMFTVPVEKLSASFIPHILAARGIGGEFGRLIMGAVIILGSAGAVNAMLFSNSAANAGTFESPTIQKTPWLRWLERPASWAILAGIVIGILMAVGMAGEEIIDSYVRAGLIVWLFYYGAIHLTLLLHIFTKSASAHQSKFSWFLPAVGAASMIYGGTALLLSDDDLMAMLKFALAIMMIVAFLVLGNRRLRSNGQSERNKTDNRPFRLSG